MRILLDEQIPVDLKALIDDDLEPVHVLDHGWGNIENGALLRAAEQEFDAFVTMDKSLPHQQNLSAIRMGIVIVRAVSNRYEDLAPLAPEIRKALRAVHVGEVAYVRGR